jgi:hypothetical protein
VHQQDGERPPDGLDLRQCAQRLADRGRERQLGRRQERVGGEVIAGRAEVRRVDERVLVLLAQFLLLLARQHRECGQPAAAVAEVDRARDEQVGAHPGQRPEHLLLGVLDPARERRDRDHQRDPDGEPERGDQRPPAPAGELGADEAEQEHLRQFGGSVVRLRPLPTGKERFGSQYDHGACLLARALRGPA